ncbi:MAG TPA: hypothetical protein DEF18_07535 [Muricauda sp.]|nr:hypothetical protein [Allomuricauda sp.]MBC72855.1 hypothetical protein [Allomuricauda sp.]HBU77939.1 hypothetical protein [Allomuricauda sp.]
MSGGSNFPFLVVSSIVHPLLVTSKGNDGFMHSAIMEKSRGPWEYYKSNSFKTIPNQVPIS